MRPPVARVGTAELTEDELFSAADSSVRTRGTLRAFINEWVVNELLYQEAERRGLANNDQIRKQLEATRKRLAIEALLNKEVYGNAGGEVTDSDVVAFFNKNASTFSLREDVARASYGLFSERDAANQFRASILRGAGWEEALNLVRRDSVNARYLRAIARNQYFTQATLYPEELWKLARTLPKEEVSYVVQTSAGYYVFALHAIRHVGEIPELEYVRNDVRDRLLIEHRRVRYEQLVTDLRAMHQVEVNLSIADTEGGIRE